MSPRSSDATFLRGVFAHDQDTESVAGFVESRDIVRLRIAFDVDELRAALGEVSDRLGFEGDVAAGFGSISLTRRPGVAATTSADRSGRYWLRGDDRYVEEPQEELVDESCYSELVPQARDTYFAHVHEQLRTIATIGRMRLLRKPPHNCNSWHRDPEPRIHVPIVTNPGCLMIVNHHVTHLVADGSAYFTDTRGYHMGVNGGLSDRVHLVAAVVA